MTSQDSLQVFQKDFLKGKVAIITGGATGICKGMTEALMRHGCQTAIVSRNLDQLVKSAKELELATGSRCIAIQVLVALHDHFLYSLD